MVPEYLIPILLFLAGASTSVINMMAGGGSLITLGLMLTLGVDASVANGTNRIGILIGAGSGAATYKTEKITDIRQSLKFGAFAIPGAVLGAYYSIQLDDKLFQQIIAIIMIGVLITLFIPKKQQAIIDTAKTSIFIYPVMFLIGIYGGFIQVGIGYMLMAALRHIARYDLITTNMHKVFVVTIYSIPSLLVFAFSAKINWEYAFFLSMGHAVGSWVAVKLAIKKGEKFVKIILSIAVILMILKFSLTF